MATRPLEDAKEAAEADAVAKDPGAEGGPRYPLRVAVERDGQRFEAEYSVDDLENVPLLVERTLLPGERRRRAWMKDEWVSNIQAVDFRVHVGGEGPTWSTAVTAKEVLPLLSRYATRDARQLRTALEGVSAVDVYYNPYDFASIVSASSDPSARAADMTQSVFRLLEPYKSPWEVSTESRVGPEVARDSELLEILREIERNTETECRASTPDLDSSLKELGPARVLLGGLVGAGLLLILTGGFQRIGEKLVDVVTIHLRKLLTLLFTRRDPDGAGAQVRHLRLRVPIGSCWVDVWFGDLNHVRECLARKGTSASLEAVLADLGNKLEEFAQRIASRGFGCTAQERNMVQLFAEGSGLPFWVWTSWTRP